MDYFICICLNFKKREQLNNKKNSTIHSQQHETFISDNFNFHFSQFKNVESTLSYIPERIVKILFVLFEVAHLNEEKTNASEREKRT